MVIVLVLLVFLAVSARMVPVLLWQTDPTDAWAQAYYGLHIRTFGNSPIDRVHPETEPSYPWAVAWFISHFPRHRTLLAGTLANVAISLIEMGVAGLMAYGLSERIGLGEPAWVGLASAGVYAVLPQVLSLWSGVYSVSARPIGALLANLGMLMMVMAETSSRMWYGPFVLVVLGCILSSKFALQALILGVVTVAIASGSAWPVLAFAGGIAMAALVTRGAAMTILRGHFWHTKFYQGHLQFHHLATTTRALSLYGFLRSLPGRSGRGDLLKAVHQTPMVRVLVFVPWLVLFVPAFLLLPPDPRIRLLEWILLASLVAIPLIGLESLRFLGEPDRYVMFMGTMPLAILIGLLTTTAFAWKVTYVVLFATSGALSAAIVYARSRMVVEKDVRSESELGVFLDQASGHSRERVIVFPVNLTPKLMAFCERHFVTLFMNAPSTPSGQESLRALFPEQYPFPASDLSVLRDRFLVRHLVLSRRHVNAEYLRRQGGTIDLIPRVPTEPAFQNDGFIVYDLQQTTTNDAHVRAKPA